MLAAVLTALLGVVPEQDQVYVAVAATVVNAVLSALGFKQGKTAALKEANNEPG
jgi:hypothetical protein